MNDPNIDREWDSRDGRKKIVGVHANGAYLVQTEGQAFPTLISKASLEGEISFDERAAASRQQMAERVEQQRAVNGCMKKLVCVRSLK